MTGRSQNYADTVTAIFNEEDIDSPISIFKIPNSLTRGKPEAYVPQLGGLGPIHHWRTRLEHMQMYKLVQAKRIHNGLMPSLKFEELIKFLKKVAPSVRASYNIYLEMEDDVLACTMAVDGLFLFNLLCCHGIKKQDQLTDLRSKLCHLVNPAETERRLDHKATAVQEVMMLENQIPIFVLKCTLIKESSELSDWKEIVTHFFPEILCRFCELFSPLKPVENYPLYKALKHAHLLDLMYHLVTLMHSPEWNAEEEEEELKSLQEPYQDANSKTEISTPAGRMSMLVDGDGIDAATSLSKLLAQGPELQKLVYLVKGLLGIGSEAWSKIRSIAVKEVPAKEIFIPRASESIKLE